MNEQPAGIKAPAAETTRATEADWRQHAIALGVNPDQADDARYFGALARAEGIIDSFRYHKPSDEQVQRIADVRQGCITLAKLLLRTVGSSADQTVALRKLHECMMTANKSIVCESPVVNAG